MFIGKLKLNIMYNIVNKTLFTLFNPLIDDAVLGLL